jgi:hypothetical protein
MKWIITQYNRAVFPTFLSPTKNTIELSAATAYPPYLRERSITIAIPKSAITIAII